MGISRVGDVPLARWARRKLDPGQIGLERCALEVCRAVGQRTRKDDRIGMELLVLAVVPPRSGPGVRVLGAIEVEVLVHEYRGTILVMLIRPTSSAWTNTHQLHGSFMVALRTAAS